MSVFASLEKYLLRIKSKVTSAKTSVETPVVRRLHSLVRRPLCKVILQDMSNPVRFAHGSTSGIPKIC